MPLLDAAPLIIAHVHGYFREEGVDAQLHRQLGWANVRDKLTFGHLDASHALLGMPLISHLGRDSFAEPLIALMALGTGGNAITARNEIYDSGVCSAADLAVFLRQPGCGRLIVGHVFSSSMHHYLLRSWLDSAGINPDKDVKLCVIPPPQMADHMRGGYVDLFCVGEPWNTLAAREGYGVPIVATTDILPAHPEKIFAVTQRFARAHPELLVPMIRAILGASEWCDQAANRAALAAILAKSEYVAQPAEVLEQSLSIGRQFGTSRSPHSSRPADWSMHSFAPQSTFPSKMHPVWMLLEMIRWGHLHAEADVVSIAERCCDTAPYRQAAATLKIACPKDDFAPLPLRHGRVLSRETLGAITREKMMQFKSSMEPPGKPPARRNVRTAERTF